jgi:acyl-CoA thioesterase-2
VTSALDDLVALLDLERLEENIFRGRSPETSFQRVFGGQVAGQALVAAGRTVPADRPVHSLHAYFLRPGDPAIPIVYTVDRLRDGRSFTTRRVVAIQHGVAIFNLTASFMLPAEGLVHQDPMPAAPDPETLVNIEQQLASQPVAVEVLRQHQAIDLRYVGPPPALALPIDPDAEPGDPAVWMRADGDLPDDPLLHVCLLTYASDLTLIDSIMLRHGLSWQMGRVSAASLDHAMWFHRPFRADRWLLYSQHSPASGGQRGLAAGRVFTQDGDLAVTVVQEGLVRIPRS